VTCSLKFALLCHPRCFFTSNTLGSSPQETAKDYVDRVWSLQYLVSGPLCGVAGPLAGVSLASDEFKGQPNFTHAIRFRFGNLQNVDRFLCSDKTRDMVRTLSVAAAASSTITYTASIPNELESIFQRGAEWDEGFELLVGLQKQTNGSDDDVAEFLELTCQLASSSAFGAVQAAVGKVSSLIEHSGDAERDILQLLEFVMLVRFQAADQLQAFVECPPVAAIFEKDERAPVRAIWAGVLELAPVEKRNNSPPGWRNPRMQ
jgi:hypothetical protein